MSDPPEGRDRPGPEAAAAPGDDRAALPVAVATRAGALAPAHEPGWIWQAIRQVGPAIRRLGEPFVTLVEALVRSVGQAAAAVRPTPADRDPTETVGFTIAAVALGAKMAAVDKRRHESQVRAFHEVFQVPEAERGHVRRLFDIASATADGYEVYARRIAQLLRGREAVKEKLLDALFHIAWGDDRIVQPELDFLRRVAGIFGFDDRAFDRIAAAHGIGTPSPFTLLGVSADADWPEVQRAYRRLMKEHHPDRLVAEGMPEELVRLAHDRVAAFTAAYEALRAQYRQTGRLAADPAG